MKHTLYWLKQSRANHIQKDLQVKYNSEFLCFQSKCSDLIYIDKIEHGQIGPSWTSLIQCMHLNSLGDVYTVLVQTVQANQSQISKSNIILTGISLVPIQKSESEHLEN